MTTYHYDTKLGDRAKAQRDAERDAMEKAGPCPNCGAAPRVDLLEVTMQYGKWAWIPGHITCSARCYEQDPDAYIAAVRNQQKLWEAQ